MGVADRLAETFNRMAPAAVDNATPPIAGMGQAPYGLQIEVLKQASGRVQKGEGSDIDRMLVDTMGRAGMQNAGMIWKGQDRRLESALGENMSGYIGINDYGFKGKRQYIADRRYLLDLYVVAYNNADVRTAITHQRNEIFRRGFDWAQKWEYKCPADDEEFTAIDARKMDYKHKHKLRNKTTGEIVEKEVPLDMPDEGQKVEFDKFIESCNYFGQSLETILRECWDDINVCDDAFLFVSKEYTAEQETGEDGQPTGEWEITGKPKFIFRLDPVLVEFDLDQRGIPGMRHHICLIHRADLLEVPPGEGWELEWKGQCPKCNLPTYPTIYKYNESYLQGGYGTAQAKVLYLTAEEVIHWSYYTPCFDDQTEIMTRTRGWINFADLTMEDEVAALKDDKEFVWERPTHVYKLPYRGKMLSFNTRRFNMVVTPNHGLRVKKRGGDWQRTEAKDVAQWSGGSMSGHAEEWQGTEPETYLLPAYKHKAARELPIEAWLEFLGYYISEGFTEPQRTSIAQNEGPVLERIKIVCDLLGFKWTPDKDGIRISNVQLASHLALYGKRASNKEAGTTKEYSSRLLQIFLDAYLEGDGMKHGKGIYFWTISPKLADDIQEIAIKLGWACRLTYRKDTERFIIDGYLSRRAMSWDKRNNIVSEVDYDGFVYCCEVPSHVIMVRRKNERERGNESITGVWSYNSELYGYPPVLSIYEKALTLIGMDRYIYDYFYERKVPQGIISTVTDDPRGIESVKSELQARMQQDPHYIPWISVSAKTGQGKTEFVRFAYTLDELNYLPVREEIRERIAGIYGVSAIWMSSVQGIGGLNAESEQLQVMSRVVEGAQRVFQEQVFPSLMQHFGITDWDMELLRPEEDSELAELQISQARATHAQTMQLIGFGIEYDQDKDEFTFTGTVPSMQEQMQQQQEQANIMGEQQPPGGEFPGGGPAPPAPDVGTQL